MADIRIKDLATTATTTASDDFMAVDGVTNGTRKLSAATPAFLTSVTTPSLTAPASIDLTLAGGSSGASLVLGQGATAGAFTLTPTGTGSLTVNLSGSGSLANSTWNSGGAAGVGFDYKRTTATATLGGGLASINAYNGATRAAILEFNGDAATDSGRFDWWVKPTGGGLTQVMTLKSTGNLLIGTTSETGLTGAGGLRVAATTSAGSSITGSLVVGNLTAATTVGIGAGNIWAGTVIVSPVFGASNTNTKYHAEVSSNTATYIEATRGGIITHTIGSGDTNGGTLLFSSDNLGTYGARFASTVSAASSITGALRVGDGSTAATNVAIGGGKVNIGDTTAGSSGAGALVVAGGISAGNSGAASYFGGTVTSLAAKMGTGFAGFAEFSHATGFGVAGTYALIQDSTGETYLNTASGKNLYLRVANSNALTLTSTTATFAGAVIGTPSALSGAGAVPITALTASLTSTGAAQAITLANGTAGQILNIVHVVDGGSMVLTPTTKIGFTTVTFTNVGESVALVYTAAGWAVTGSYLAVIA